MKYFLFFCRKLENMNNSTVTSISNKMYSVPEGMTISGYYKDEYASVLTADALSFIKVLHDTFNSERVALLKTREQVQHNIDNGILPDFLAETEKIRNSDWAVNPVLKDLQDRRVEITGPVDRKMIINALNSGAKVFMADFEDSNSPNWQNTIEGQINLRDAIQGTIAYTNENGKEYSLNEKTATLLVRPRGWHLAEQHIQIDGVAIAASFVDFGLYFFHLAKPLIAKGSGPYFYLPKLESHQEARLWNKIFVFSQEYCGILQGTIKATVLIETILAAFQVNELLWELREHSAGLNCGRWDYIFSFIKKFRNIEGYIFPERGQVTMTVPFMRAYTQLVVKTCHKRGIHAIGGMAAQIPVKSNAAENDKAIEKVKADKLREVTDGHDGTWVAHPGLVPVAMEIFDQYMTTPNQILTKSRADFSCTAKELISLPEGTITEEGLRLNINVGILYIESWLRGNGAAAIYNMMEDAATAEISRTQVWQWLKAKATLNDGRIMTKELYGKLLDEELLKIEQYVGTEAFNKGRFEEALDIFNDLVLEEEFTEFLTLPAYQHIV